ncbi:transposase family protein [Marinobacter sp. 1-3A]|uniref:DDE-type integrase/transposase/recombinase n=1 Tax=Marinobacter sp. 1-3A TaxID=2582920 RepID=UPI001903D602|nr:DDE-type integrase/transposase/recombinase [Marinobacter sp. 1-3A]MBK1875123.1 transposase family protein [Marinobacter sp. 1-3A]
MQLIDEARTEGARLKSACAELGIGANTSYRRWKAGGEDGRPGAPKQTPSHALTTMEKAMILAVCHQSDYASLPPSQVVPLLMDDYGWYIASESSFYRVLSEHNENHRRGARRHSGRVGPPRRHEANRPNQVWCWDVTYLKSTIRGRFFYLYFMLDVYSRKIVGAEVFDAESAANSEVVLRKALLREGCANNPPVVHSDSNNVRARYS